MGTALSHNVDLSTNEYILKFIGKESISPNDPFWNRFLAFNISLPKTSEDQLALDTKIEPFCQQLLTNNLSSGNIGFLMQVFLTRASELLAATNTDDNLFTWQTFNALFIIRCLLKYFMDVITEEQLMEHIECCSNNTSRLETFIGALMGIIVDVPLKDFTYSIHLECIICLLILLSVHLHSQVKADHSNIYRLIMRGRHAIHAPILIKSLLQNFIDQKKAPPLYGTNSSHQSIVFGFASGLWSIFSFNRKPNNVADSGSNGLVDTPLATHSLSLILVLTNHCTSQLNPYRQSLFTCANSEDNSPIAPTKASSLFKINYGELYITLCKQAHLDSATLLLYLLLHRNSSFRKYLLDRMDTEELIIPILKTLYQAPNCDSHHIYMSLIILLILSEDEGFNKGIHGTKLKAVSWYLERSLPEISLGGLLVLVVIRTVQYNMLKMRDKYLHTNCLAALANMSSQFWNLHPYVSQRLVSLFETLAKRYNKYLQKLESSKKDVVVNIAQNSSDSEQDVVVLEEVLRMVLEIFNSCLVNQLINNPNLVYTLLYKKQIFESFRSNPAFQDIVQNIEVIIEYFSDQLAIKSQEHEVDFHEVFLVIQEGAKHWPKEKLTKFPDLKFKYVEEEQPEEFFIPYVWSLVSHHSLLQWGTEGSTFLNAVC
ncbi:hypothetical protein RN001_000134 [Aquatica leii]|uniref:Dymeclin n=1 Tax=Aquatica leii TaxID=1421715 RepID=A0AAN7QLV8_9COLE|nr:hypothetical protein RN001_000134 [Aquatica leii]